MSEPEFVELGRGGRRRPRWVFIAAFGALLLVVAGFVVVQRSTGGPACKTRVVLESVSGGDRVVYNVADQHGNDVVRYIYLSDQPLTEKFAWADPAPGARLAMLWLTAPGVDAPLTEGSEFGLGAGTTGRREFAPVATDDDRLMGAAARPGTGSLTVESVDDLTCLRFDYKNEVAALAGTIAIVVTEDDEDRGQ